MLKCALLLAALSLCHSHRNALEPLNAYRHLLQHKEPPLKLSKAAEENASDVEELWLEQPIDHFTKPRTNSTWPMRYLRNARYFRPGGGIFIFVGGEWEITSAYLLTGYMYDLAKQHSGMLYYTEHRYYGQSWSNNGTTLEDLKYLSVRQSLADLKHFITEQKRSSKDLSKAKVILVGGSYAGSMVAWFTRLYPKVASASWASSAPMHAKLDYYEYMQIVGAGIKQQGGQECYDHLAAGMADIARLFKENDAEQVLSRLHICQNFNVTRSLDVSSFFNGVGNYFADLVQSHSAHIPDVCADLRAQHDDPLEALVKYLHHVFWLMGEPSRRHEVQCLDFSFEAMQVAYESLRSWFYQTCTEFGWYATTATHATQQQHQHPFGRQVPLAFFQQLCQGIFGDTFTLEMLAAGVLQTNEHLALKHNNHSPLNNNNNNNYERVIFTHGALDPWRAVGLQAGSNVIIVPGYSHTADLGSLSFDDSVALSVAKLKVAIFLRRALRG